jgi:hypothetical protein
MPEIETERLRHRRLRIEDLSDLMTIVGDSEVMTYLGVDGGTTLSEEEAEDALTKMIALIGMTYQKDINYQGVDAVCYVATRETFEADSSTYSVTRD